MLLSFGSYSVGTLHSTVANAICHWLIIKDSFFNFSNQLQTREQICNLSVSVLFLNYLLLRYFFHHTSWLLTFVSKIGPISHQAVVKFGLDFSFSKYAESLITPGYRPGEER